MSNDGMNTITVQWISLREDRTSFIARVPEGITLAITQQEDGKWLAWADRGDEFRSCLGIDGREAASLEALRFGSDFIKDQG